MTETELAWLAGILEGEGSFILSTSRWGGRKYRYARIALSMTDRDVVERARLISGADCKLFEPAVKKANRKQQYRLWIDGKNAVRLMNLLRPLMGARRRAQIDEVLSQHEGLSDDQRSVVNRAVNTRNWDKKTGLNDEKRLSIRQDPRPVRHIAKHYGVSAPTIRRIKS